MNQRSSDYEATKSSSRLTKGVDAFSFLYGLFLAVTDDPIRYL